MQTSCNFAADNALLICYYRAGLKWAVHDNYKLYYLKTGHTATETSAENCRPI